MKMEINYKNEIQGKQNYQNISLFNIGRETDLKINVNLIKCKEII